MFSSPIIIIILIVITVVALTYSVFLHIKLKRFLTGSNGATLEPILLEDRTNVSKVQVENQVIRTRLDTLEKKMSQSVRAVETVRFNPFADQGSNQSFSTALLDENGDGVVFSSLYGRDRVSIFAKPIEHGASTYELTEEEKHVISNTTKKQYGK